MSQQALHLAKVGAASEHAAGETVPHASVRCRSQAASCQVEQLSGPREVALPLRVAL
jgi:hypothetical protein